MFGADSPFDRDLLYTIATKYDQYNDFQQQDAHEFLRHLLDAMRMEEIDVSYSLHYGPIITCLREFADYQEAAAAAAAAQVKEEKETERGARISISPNSGEWCARRRKADIGT